MANDLTPAEIGALVTSVTGTLSEASRSQAEVQRAQIQAESDRQRMHFEAMERQAVREYKVLVGGLLGVGGTIAALLFAGQYQLAYSCIAFFAGSAFGYGVGRARRQ